MKDLIHSSLLVTGTRVAGIVLQSLLVLLLARALPVSHMDVFALGYAGLGFARILGLVGTDQVTMRLTAATENNRHDRRLQGHLNTSLFLVTALNVLIAVAVTVVAFWTKPWLSGELGPFSTSLLLVACAIPAFAIIGLLTAQLRGFDYNVLARIPDSVVLQLLFGMGLVFFLMRRELDLVSAFLSLALAAWIVAAVYVLIRFRIAIDLTATPTWKAARMLLTEGREVLYALTVTALAARAPLLFSAPLLGPAATAVLDIATRFGTLPTITTSSVTATFSPRFAALVYTDNRQDLSRALSLSSVLAAAPALICLAAIGLGAPFLIRAILPVAYAQAYPPKLVICAAAVINAAIGVASTLLFMAGESHVVRNFSLAQLIAICVLSPALGLPFGPLGFALAILAGTIVRDFGLAVWASRQFRIELSPLGIGR